MSMSAKRFFDFVKKQADLINHPAHYGGDTVYEAIKVIEAWALDFCLGNAVKYISRAGKKDDAIEDLKKAKWYLERKISQLEKENGDESGDSDGMHGKAHPAYRQRLYDSRGRVGIHKQGRGRGKARGSRGRKKAD